MSWVAAAIGGSALIGAFSSNKAAKGQQAAAEQATAETRRQYDTTRADLSPWMGAGNLSLAKLMEGMGLGSRGSMSAPDRSQFTRTQSIQGAPGASGGYRPPYNPYNPNNGIQNDYGLGRGPVSGATTQTSFDQAGFDQAQAAYQNQPESDFYGSLLKPFGMDDFEESPSYQWQLQQGKAALDKGANARGNYYAPQTLQDLGKFQQGLASTEFGNAYNRYTQNQNQQYNMLSGLSGSGQNAAAGIGGFGANAAANAGNFGMQGANAAAQGTMGVANALSGGAMGLAGYNQYLQGMNAPSYGDGFHTAPNYNTMPMGRK